MKDWINPINENATKELNVKGKGGYYLDFFFPNKMIALEIDGSQHEDPERKALDIKKDKALIENGYKVYRIKWKEIQSDKGKAYIKEEIDKFLIFYRVMG